MIELRRRRLERRPVQFTSEARISRTKRELFALDPIHHAPVHQGHPHLAEQAATVEGGVAGFRLQLVEIDHHGSVQVAEHEVGGGLGLAVSRPGS